VIQARDRLADAVAMPLPPFRLHPGEPLGPGLKRLGVEAIDEAISGFYEGEEMFREAVHITRKSTKRIRAMLRLVRFEVGEQVYQFENEWMRDTARLLSEVRTSSTMTQGVADIREMYGPLLAEGTFDEVVERTTIYRDRTEQRVMEDPEIVPRVVSNLERARSRYESWPTNPEAKSGTITGPLGRV
jgi:hypothetical protein